MRFLYFIFILTFSNFSLAETEELIEPIENEIEQLPKTNAIDERMADEAVSELVDFSLIPHKPNYLLPFSFNDKIQDYDIYQNNGTPYQRLEVKYQISFKMPLFHHIGDLPISGYVAYTQLSLWQAYNSASSSPFRETNYEPEAFLIWDLDQTLGFDWRFKSASFGFTHQSNGRSEPSSRSWNRLNSHFIFDRDNFVVTINPWYRLEYTEDDNPDLLDYYGHGKITLAYKHNEHLYSFTSQNNIESSFSRGYIGATWSFPLYEKIKGYIQISSGYGNSLIEYNQYTNTIGLGVAISDIL